MKTVALATVAAILLAALVLHDLGARRQNSALRASAAQLAGEIERSRQEAVARRQQENAVLARLAVDTARRDTVYLRTKSRLDSVLVHHPDTVLVDAVGAALDAAEARVLARDSIIQVQRQGIAWRDSLLQDRDTLLSRSQALLATALRQRAPRFVVMVGPVCGTQGCGVGIGAGLRIF